MAKRKKYAAASGSGTVVRIGPREVETKGLAESFWTDFYHRCLTVYWPVFFGGAAALFVLLNVVFAFLYWLGHEPVANVAGNAPLGLFYFSIETLATVGYGDMYPRTNYAHVVVTAEIFTGMCFLAVLTGLVFARFSRPRARFLFAAHPVVGMHQGDPTLMLRIANARHNTISQATARLWLFRLENTSEGHQLRRYYELKLDRDEHPMFMLSWSIFHKIDPASPLYGLSAHDLAALDGALTLNVSGVDDASKQELYARRVYSYRDIRWNHRYRDITSISREGRLLIDYDLFHDTVAEES